MPYFVILILVALVLYTIAIWSETIVKQLKPWIIIIFSIALICDIISTSKMYFLAGNQELNLHSVAGYAALGIMLLHFIWVILAIIGFKNLAFYFNRYSVYAWFFWLITFGTGVYHRL